MITTAFGFITFVFVSLAIYLWLSNKYENCKLFKVIPPLLFMYVFFVAVTNLGLFDMGDGSAVLAAKKAMTNYGVPLLVFAVIVQCDPRRILKLGPKMIMTFLITSISLIFGTFVGAMIFAGKLGIPDIPETFGTLLSSFIGGPENLFAVANGVSLSDEALSNVLILVEVVYSPWLIFLMCGLPLLSKKFNKFTHADLAPVEAAGARIDLNPQEKRPVTITDVYTVIGSAVLMESVCMLLGKLINKLIPSWPSGVVMYILITIFAMIVAVKTKLGQNPFLKPFATGICLTQVAIGTLGVDLSYFLHAGWMLAASVTILFIHVIIMVIYAKISKTDLYTLGCASIAAIGGNSSAPVVASVYAEQSQAYVSIATIMAAFGSIIGTVSGLVVVKALHMIL